MIRNFIVLVLALIYFDANAQKAMPVEKMIVEAACGECQFHMKGKGCQLAVLINNKPYFVDGTSIDDHGDAHSKEGFCNATRKAEVSGQIVNNRFVATSFKLLPERALKKKASSN